MCEKKIKLYEYIWQRCKTREVRKTQIDNKMEKGDRKKWMREMEDECEWENKRKDEIIVNKKR